MYAIIVALVLISFLCGYLAGVIQKGVEININHNKIPDTPKEYNESLADMLPQETQQYYNQTNGQNLF